MTLKPATPNQKINAFGNLHDKAEALRRFRWDPQSLVSKVSKPKPLVSPITESLQEQRAIVPLLGPDGKPIKADYLEARRIAAESGGQLPSNVTHDEVLVKLWGALPEAEKAKLREYYGAWARELVVYPAKDGEFISGQDIVDSKTGWILSWSEVIKLIPASELVGKLKGLFLDPQDFAEDDGRIIVLPKSIVLLHPFIQENGGVGKVHEATRIPLGLTPQTDEEARTLYRDDTVRLGLLSRGIDLFLGYNRRRVDLYCQPSVRFGVAVER